MTPDRLAALRAFLAPGGDYTRSELAELFAEIDRLTPRWQEGVPPAEMDGVLVWREGEDWPVQIGIADKDSIYNPGSVWYYTNPDAEEEPWGTARWCPIGRPT